MTREEVVGKIVELFKSKYDINLLDYPEQISLQMSVLNLPKRHM
jgi:hypothetical protein